MGRCLDQCRDLRDTVGSQANGGRVDTNRSDRVVIIIANRRADGNIADFEFLVGHGVTLNLNLDPYSNLRHKTVKIGNDGDIYRFIFEPGFDLGLLKWKLSLN